MSLRLFGILLGARECFRGFMGVGRYDIFYDCVFALRKVFFIFSFLFILRFGKFFWRGVYGFVYHFC